jgi:3'5'-cyclic nucleotide phosphodiesterase
MLRKTKLREKFIDEVDALTLLVAGIGHDLDHPGLNNLYFQKTGNVFS